MRLTVLIAMLAVLYALAWALSPITQPVPRHFEFQCITDPSGIKPKSLTPGLVCGSPLAPAREP